VAVGTGALLSNLTGSGNTAIGTDALESSNGSGNIALGAFAGLNTNGNFNILIGNLGVFGESHTIRIGTQSDQTDAYISGVYTATAADRPVYVDADGHLGTLSSSRRYKENIKAMEKESEALFALKPATFHYKKDPASTRSFGLIAEEVAQVSPDLITRDEHGQPQTVRYEAVNAMLLNEFLKEHEAFLEEQRKVQRLEAALEAVNARLKEQDAKIEKISAQVKVSAATPQIVSNQ
jgi:Chaperone of endosialidase